MGAPALRLTRELAHDLRASLHGLSLALEMANDGLPEGVQGRTLRCLTLASAEVAQLDRTIEQVGLWIRLLNRDYTPRPARMDLTAVLKEYLARPNPLREEQHFAVELPEAPVTVVGDPHIVRPALEGLVDFIRALSPGLEQERPALRLEQGRITVKGPATWLPIFESALTNLTPPPKGAGAVRWLVGPALAVAVCRVSGGSVQVRSEKDGCSLRLHWFEP
ncbi:MAG: hypothetical protein ACOY93_22390 [Bacillota bacterium]